MGRKHGQGNVGSFVAMPIRIALAITTMKAKVRCETCPSRVFGIFCNLPKEAMQEFTSYVVINIYKRGQVLFYEGNHPQGLFCIYTGKIKLYKGGSLGRQYILNIAGRGQLLGYRNLFTDTPYETSAEALEDSSVCFVDRTAFLLLLSKNPSLATQIIKKLSEEISVLEEKLVDLVDKPARVRLARFLLDLKEMHGKPVADGVELIIPLSREEIAESTGVTRETATRLLTYLKDRGCLDLDGPRILVKDSSLLSRIAQIPIQSCV